MFNLIISSLFLMIIFSLYYIVGSAVETLLIKKIKLFPFHIICGWLIVFFIGFLIGFPMQILAKSWDLFATIYSCTLIGVTIFSIIVVSKENIKFNLKKAKNLFRKNISQYWLVYLLTIVFTVFCVTNLQSYTLDNYNDDYYIVKMVHMVHSNPILKDNFFLGYSYDHFSIKSIWQQQGYRVFNTYELLYSYFGTITHVPLVYFAKVTMTFHNYLICFLVYTLFSNIFLNESKAQYGLLLLPLLLIPAGFAAKAGLPITIRMFENWRFQTAIYMGGSIVRVCAFPLLIYCVYQIFLKNYHILFVVPIVIITLLSFQTTSISYFLFLLPFFILVFIMLTVVKAKRSPERKNKYINFIVISVMILFFMIVVANSDYLIIDVTKKIHATNILKDFTDMNNKYYPYYVNVFTYDFFAKYAFVILISLCFLCKEKNAKAVGVLLLMLFLVFRLNKSKLFVSFVSFEFYCTARMLTSMLLVVMVSFGIVITLVLNRLKIKKNIVLKTVSLCILVINILIVSTNIDEITKYVEPGDGIVKQGYSLKPLFVNNKYLPNMFVEIGDYFDKLPGAKYGVYAESVIQLKGVEYSSQGLLLCSKKIRYSTYGNVYSLGSIDKNKQKLNWANFVLNEYTMNINKWDKYHTYDAIKTSLEAANLRFILTTRIKVEKDLTRNEWEIVCGSNKKGFWLLKAPY